MEKNIKVSNPELCSKCKGRGWCGKKCPILSRFSSYMPEPKKNFSGSSPPEIFVGRYGYPNVNMGILSPQEHGKTESYSMPELWHSQKFGISKILGLRGKLVYGRFKENIKSKNKKFLKTMQEISLADRNVSTKISLKKTPYKNIQIDASSPVIGNPAPLRKAILQENPHVNRKAEYLSYDSDAKATTGIQELYYSNVPVTHITKVLSAGLLGQKKNRKLVPSRWSITATDNTISKLLLKRIKYYQEINEIQLFHSEYLGNHYEILLLPDKFSFEVLEAKIPGSVWNPSLKSSLFIAKDYESFQGRKTYAENVSGAYYANRLALCEYLEKRKRQASCLIMRECRPEYYAPCGVGVLRQASRDAFKNKPETFANIKDALQQAQKRLRLPTKVFKKKSWLLENYGKQKRLKEFFKI